MLFERLTAASHKGAFFADNNPAPITPWDDRRRNHLFRFGCSSVRLTNESFVVAHQQLRFDLLHGVKNDTHHNQQASAADDKRLISGQYTDAAKNTIDDDTDDIGRIAMKPKNSAPTNVMRESTPFR